MPVRESVTRTTKGWVGMAPAVSARPSRSKSTRAGGTRSAARAAGAAATGIVERKTIALPSPTSRLTRICLGYHGELGQGGLCGRAPPFLVNCSHTKEFMTMAAFRSLSRRQFLRGLGAAPFVPAFLSSFHELAAAERKRVKIRDVQVMVMQGASRTYTLIKITSDAGLYGIAEAYGTPGVGVKEQGLSLKPWLVGKDPLEIDTLYTT